MILSPYFWIAVLISALAIFGYGYHSGYNRANDHSESLKLHAMTKAIEKAKKQAKIDQNIAESYEVEREVVRTVFVKIKDQANENIKNNDYDSCGLDDIGLRLYNTHPGIPKDSASVIASALP